jgi:hypothetical protein
VNLEFCKGKDLRAIQRKVDMLNEGVDVEYTDIATTEFTNTAQTEDAPILHQL